MLCVASHYFNSTYRRQVTLENLIPQQVNQFLNIHSHLFFGFSFLHLVDTSRPDGKSWQGRLANYLACRLDGSNGQIAFYTSRSKHAARWLRLANTAFNCCSGGAFIAVCCKLFHMGGQYGILVFGSLAIVMPVLAVAALSLAAAFDLEARKQTFSDMRDFLTAQRALLARATADREFCQLVVETEFRLLGETVNWYSRRAFAGVA